ncbi:hypothetical protein B566_EDAN006087 [Ephemera danica]|nr:hypothetical protein B566_EDAN006087 [Ephemera danica]
MSALIFGVGVGLFIIIALWAIALLLCLVSLRSQKNIGLLGILAASFFTGFLLLLPIDSPSDPIESSRIPKIHDYYFIWRVLLIIFLALSTFRLALSRLCIRGRFWSQTRRVSSSAVVKRRMFTVTDNKSFMDKVLNNDVPVIVNFHAEWCEPCKLLSPKLQELIIPLPGVDLAVIDVEMCPDLVDAFEVKAVPAVIAVHSA